VNTQAALFARSQAVSPGGVHSPVRAFRHVDGTPVFFARGAGATLVDVDGRHYLDFCMSFGPLVLGHADPGVAAAAHAAVDDGWTFGACEPYSLALAEWIVAHVPWAERVRFVSSGTEATMSALRVARAATGRPLILKFEGCYHGHADALLVQAGSGLAGASAASSAGVGDAARGTLVAPLDDLEALEEVFVQHGAAIAAVIVEPLPANYGLLPQRAEWHDTLARLCATSGALLIFDEVISGFRVGPGGMAERLGLRPDLVCFGKVIGGGFPVGAYAGRGDLLSLVAPEGPVYQAGTLSANPVGMRAGLATLTSMEQQDGWNTLGARTRTFAAQLRNAFASLRHPLTVVDEPGLFWIHRHTGAPLRTPALIPDDNAGWFRRFFHAALNRGVYLPPSPYEVSFLSLAHTEAVLAGATAALHDAAREADRP
jgi:glutamate-1-semialdehyde 2,1-aminomutase